jgi:hypothetical protein
VDVGNLELLQHVLYGISLRGTVPPRGGRGIVGLLLQGIDVVRLRDRNELDGRERAADSAGLFPLVMRKRATVDPVMARFSDASRVNPRRPTAACTRSTVTLPAICSTTSSLTKRVSVGGGMSMTRRSKPDGSCC